jgi:hypothetical protein
VLLSLAFTAAASAQDAPGPPATPQPLTLERVQDGVALVPEYKLTELDGDFGQLVGAHVGQVVDGMLFIGAAGYWLANESRDFKLAYGGLLVGWSTPAEHRVRFGARGLIGGGSGTLGTTLTDTVAVRFQDGRGGSLARFGGGSRSRTLGPISQPGAPVTRTIRYIARDEFFLVEPQIEASTRVTEHIGVGVSAGYRWTQFNEVLGDRLDGVTGSLEVQLGW